MADLSRALTWAELPAPLRRRRWTSLVAFGCCLALPVVAASMRGGAGLAGPFLAVAAVSIVVWAASFEDPVVPVAAGAAALVLWWPLGPVAAGVVAIGLACWVDAWGLARPRTTRGPLAPALAPLLLAWVAVLVGLPVAVSAVLVGVALGSLVLERRRPALLVKLTGLTERVGRVLGAAVGFVAMVPVLVLVTVRWLASALFRYDPVQTRSAEHLRWSEVERSGPPTRLFGSGSRTRRPRGWHRLQRLAVNVVLIGVTAVAVVALLSSSMRPPSSAALDGDPRWPTLWAETVEANRQQRFDAASITRVGDFRGRYLNETDGVRASWRPPECDCRRLTVWWFGGSSAWGELQVDDETIPSHLARLAAERGVTIDIENRGQPGHTLAQEFQSFAQLVEAGDRPDLVIFYDGANDLGLQATRNAQGRGTDESVGLSAEGLLGTVLSFPGRGPSMFPRSPTGGAVDLDEPDPVLSSEQVADHAMNRYRRQVDLVEAVAARAGVPVVFVWQPTAATATDQAIDLFGGSTQSFDRVAAQAARDRLPPQVIDLADSLDAVDRPVFPDEFHTNGYGAEIVARALLERSWPTIEQLRAGT